MRFIYILSITLILPACSTLNESMQLGASMGAVSGAAATYAAARSHGGKPSSDNVMAGAAIGLVTGLITSHVLHTKFLGKTGENTSTTEMYFGYLPPNPFVLSLYKKFESGHITYSDAINEMISTSKVDIKTLQDKHTDVRRSLKSFAKQDDPDLDSLIITPADKSKKDQISEPC
ncbi:MAG: hypothetical protein ABL927_03665 [Bdellovibrionales bacterium]